MLFILFLSTFLWRKEIEFAGGTKFNADTFSAISLLANQGKNHLDLLTDKANVSRFGSCWKNAISELQVGCKFLTEDVQKDLALKLTDCFLQSSGYEPVKCEFPKSACLQKLSDRAFNAYTEFYTHTQSICYFLQSQIWQEEAEKTVNKLSFTSAKVSQKLEESEKIQENILSHQKESLFLQHDLIENSRGIAMTLKSSQENIQNIMEDFRSSTSEQKELLGDIFDSLSSFKTWAVNEFSWLSSSAFFIGAIIASFIFTSVPRTKNARIFVLLIFTVNFTFERFIHSVGLKSINSHLNLIIATDTLYAWIWLLRKFCIFLSVIVLLYTAVCYYDYNLLNYKLLLEIRDQNYKILKYIGSSKQQNFVMSKHNMRGNAQSHNLVQGSPYSEIFETPHFSSQRFPVSGNKMQSNASILINDISRDRYSFDEIDNDVEETLSLQNNEMKEKENSSGKSVSSVSCHQSISLNPVRSAYNLRSSKKFKAVEV